ITDCNDTNEATNQWMVLTSATYHRTANLGVHEHAHTLRVGIVAPTADIERLKPVLARDFGERIVCHSLVIRSFAVEVLEAFDPGVSKWEVILHVARRHNIRPEQIIAIGDDVNDLPMIRNAGLGIAMGNAHAEVLKVAKRTIRPNHEEGLSQFLEELVA